MSTFSPRTSLTTMRTREPRAPTHAPTGSTLLSLDATAIFVRWPGSRAMALISTTPSTISGTSSSKSRLTSPGCVRDTTICGPLAVRRTSTMYALRLDPTEVEQRVPGVGLLDDACDDVALAAGVLLVLHLALGFADPLEDHLLGGLRRDAA